MRHHDSQEKDLVILSSAQGISPQLRVERNGMTGWEVRGNIGKLYHDIYMCSILVLYVPEFILMNATAILELCRCKELFLAFFDCLF